ncbi:MAG: DUF4845 domain-containing protein [Pseudohongiellaceae bacterium]|jgi:hypothetical protein|nr:DUF4845 domain-containing protein [Pseudomonadota bacterium]NBQ72857.1 DUF4845 domain-containing protein [Gammaproteobacteria bacterium]
MKKTAVNNLSRQRGISSAGVLLIAVLLGLFFTVGLKVGPLYVDHNLITGLCQDLIDNGEANGMTVTEVRDRISSTLRINNVTDFDLNSIRMRKENGEAIITVAYEKRVPLIANLDIVATFDESLR